MAPALSIQAGCGLVLARNASTFSGVIKSVPVSILCGIGIPSDACHSMRMDIDVNRRRGLTSVRRPMLTMQQRDNLAILIGKYPCEPWSNFNAGWATPLVKIQRAFTVEEPTSVTCGLAGNA